MFGDVSSLIPYCKDIFLALSLVFVLNSGFPPGARDSGLLTALCSSETFRNGAVLWKITVVFWFFLLSWSTKRSQTGGWMFLNVIIVSGRHGSTRTYRSEKHQSVLQDPDLFPRLSPGKLPALKGGHEPPQPARFVQRRRAFLRQGWHNRTAGSPIPARTRLFHLFGVTHLCQTFFPAET